MDQSVGHLIGVVTLVTVLSACADPAPLGPAGGTDRIAAYGAILTYLVEDTFAGGPLYVRRAICPGGGRDASVARCQDAFSRDEQDALIDALGARHSEVSFVWALEDLAVDPEDGDGVIFAWVGPLEPRDGAYWVDAGMWCGGLCGHGRTYVVEPADDAWTVSGNAPGTGE